MNFSRYDGLPLLRLLELYILWAIGELGETQQQKLESLTPSLQVTYSQKGSWQQIIGLQMEFPEDFPNRLQEAWARNVERARGDGIHVNGEDFAKQVADKIVQA